MELLRRFRFAAFLLIVSTLIACGDGDGGLTRDESGIDHTSKPLVISLALSNQKVTGKEPQLQRHYLDMFYDLKQILQDPNGNTVWSIRSARQHASK